MLMYANVCCARRGRLACCQVLTYADVCSTYADVSLAISILAKVEEVLSARIAAAVTASPSAAGKHRK